MNGREQQVFHITAQASEGKSLSEQRRREQVQRNGTAVVERSRNHIYAFNHTCKLSQNF
jgi:hypothetical protein